MHSKFSTVASGVILAAALLVSGCATQTQISSPLPPPPAADLGPEFEVLKAPRYSYIISEAMDSAGRAHLIVALKGAKEVRHLVIGPRGMESGEIVRTGAEPKTVDLAFDRAENLHVLIDDEHLMKKGGEWVGSLRTPWKEANLDPDEVWHGFGTFVYTLGGSHWVPTAAFVKGMRDLTWAFYMGGGAMDSPTRIEWKKSVGSLLPLPWPMEVWKLMVVPEEAHYRHWYAVGMEDNQEVGAYDLRGDKAGMLHVLYQVDPSEIRFEGMLRQAAFRADGECSMPGSNGGKIAEKWYNEDRKKQTPALQLKNGASVCPINGEPVATAQVLETEKMSYKIPEDRFAIDPESGAVLMAGDEASSLVGDKAISAAPIEMPIKNAGMLLVPAGKHRFHALATGLGMERAGDSTNPVYYLEFFSGAWSAPVEIGRYSSGSAMMHVPAWEPKNDVFKIVSDDNGRALLVWPKEDGLVARWVTLK